MISFQFYIVISTFISLISIPIYKFIINRKLFTSEEHIGPQKIHINPTPRLGGVLVFLSILIINFINIFIGTNILFGGIISFLFIFFISLKEDTIGNTKPINRLFFIFIASIVFLYLSKINLDFETPVIKNFLNIKFIQIIFLILIISTAVNGFNIIDGSNGHCTFIAIISSIIMIIILYQINKIDYVYALIPFTTFLLIFLIFNFPKGLIFLGDTGAYFLGWYLSITLLLVLADSQKEISEVFFLNILFYPLFETVFSFIRKIYIKKSPFKPDDRHLHLIMINYLKFKNYKNYNNLNTFMLSHIWFFPILSLPFFYDNNIILILILLFQVLIYLLTYFFLYKAKKTIDF